MVLERVLSFLVVVGFGEISLDFGQIFTVSSNHNCNRLPIELPDPTTYVDGQQIET